MRTSIIRLITAASWPVCKSSAFLTSINIRKESTSTILRSLSSNKVAGLNSSDAYAQNDYKIEVPQVSKASESEGGLPSTNKIKGVIFDMDGTLVKPCIDFAGMRERVYEIADSDPLLQNEPEERRRGDVLELYHDFSEEGQILAKAVFEDIESNALRDMTLMESVGDLCNFLDREGILRAVLTRNVGKSVDVLHEKLWNKHSAKEFFPAVNRETEGGEGQGVLPSKPSPDAIYHICNIWGMSTKEVIMVGDSDADDIAAAFRAGCAGRVLLRYGGKSFDNDAGGGDAINDSERMEREPTLTISNLGDLLNMMEQEFPPRS